MSLRNRVVLPSLLLTLAVLAGCSSSSKGLPPPTGGFGPGNLKGTYVFSTQGEDANSNPIAMAGTFQADGNLGIKGGTIDIIDAGFTSSYAGQAISGGGYTIGADGRGTVTLSPSTATPFGTQIRLDFVLANSTQGLVTEFDPNGTGSGTLDLQSSATLSGSYAFNLSGADLLTGTPLATVGSFTVGGDGMSITGVQNFNNGNAFSSYSLTGSVTTGSGGAPGSATLATAGAFGSVGLDVYPIDSTHLKFIGSSGSAFLSGDAFTQTGASVPTSATTLAFTMAGGSGSAPLALGGLMALDGAGNITSNSEVDINESLNVVTGQLFSGTYAAGTGSPIPATGMGTVFTVSGFSVAVQFVGYPTANAGVQLLESDGVGFLDGAAVAQASGAAISSSQGYAMNLSAASANTGGEEDDIAEFSTTSTNFTGRLDINDQGALSSAQEYAGTYTVDSPATGRGELTSNAYNSGVFYAVDSSTLLFLDAGDGLLVGTGTMLEQNAGSQSAAAAKRLIVPHRLLLPRAGKQAKPAFQHK